jgi:autotransporter-associated beta strand protein
MGGWTFWRRIDRRRTRVRHGVGVARPEALESRTLLAVTTTFRPDPYPNQAPKVFDRSAVVEAGVATRTPNVLSGQFDVESDMLSVMSFTQPAHGTVGRNGDDTFTYTPAAGYIGPDSFTFTIGDGRGGVSTGTMSLSVIRPTGDWSTTNFVNLARLQAGGVPLDLGTGTTTVPRFFDFNGDGLTDILVAGAGRVTYLRNTGTATAPAFAAGVRVQAAGADIQVGTGRVALSVVDMDTDGRRDLVLVGTSDLKVRWYRNTGTATSPVFAAGTILKAANGTSDFVAANIRCDVADWNGDGRPDVITGSYSGSVQVALNVGTSAAPRFGTASTAIDAAGRTLSGSYNLNVRIVDVNRDGLADLVDSYNWGTINYRINTGSAAQPLLPGSATFAVTDPAGATVNFQSVANGPIVDFADIDGDGTIDLLAGGENPGTLYLGSGQSGQTYLAGIDAILAAHPTTLGAWLADPANATEKATLQRLEGALYDYVVNLATPTQKATIRAGLIAQMQAYPQLMRLQTLDTAAHPGIPSLAAQTWLTALMTDYHGPATRTAICDAAQFPARGQPGGSYRTLVEDLGLFLIDNYQNPAGAEAIYQSVRNVPRNVYPGTGITMADWLGGKTYLVRGHLKNGFNGYPDNGTTEYGFGGDAQAVIGGRGAENWFMTVVHHEMMHDMDAYVNQFPDLRRRWGQVLVHAGGHDAAGINYLVADPATGWYSATLTQTLWRDRGWWNGTDAWATTLDAFYATGPGAAWTTYGFMRGNIRWFLDNPQESLATQANQFWNSGEGRLEVAVNRWCRGFDSDLTEVLFFMDVLSQGFDKMQLCENDGSSDRVISFASLRRNQWGYIDGVTVNGHDYRFTVNDRGRVTTLLSPLPPAVTAAASASPATVTGTATMLSAAATATNGAGQASLTYAWAATGLPAGAAAPTFSVNGTAKAGTVVATFSKAGTYTFTVTVTDTATPGLPFATSEVTVTVVPTASSLLIAPGAATVAAGGTRQFVARETDQFGESLGSAVAATWSLSPATGAGTVSAAGLYTAPATPTAATITAMAGGRTATARVQVGAIATWTNAAGGSWAAAANWQSGTVPGGANVVADLSTLDLAAAATVTLDGARTVGGLVFADATPDADWTLGAGTGGTLTLDVTSGTPLVVVDTRTATMSAALAGADGIRKAGSGTLRQTVNANFTGGLTIDAGTWYVGAGGWYVNPFGQRNQVTVNGGATLQTAGAHSLGVDQNTVWINGGTLLLGAENYVTTLRMTGGRVTGGELRNWGGTMTFDAAATAARIESKFNLVGNAVLSVADGTAAEDLVVSGVISNTKSLTKRGAGTLVLTASNTFSGGLIVEEGEVIVRNAAALGTGAVTVRAGARLTLDLAGAGLSLPGLTMQGRLDVGRSLVTVSAGMTAATLQAALSSGRGDGNWSAASGIVSAAVAAEIAASRPRTLGWIDAGGGVLAFGFAAAGDANLDGLVDSLDIGELFAGGMYDGPAGAVWQQGDFNYDGLVDSLDIGEFLGSSLYDTGAYVDQAAPAAVAASASTDGGHLAAIELAFIAIANDQTTPTSRTRWPVAPPPIA